MECVIRVSLWWKKMEFASSELNHSCSGELPSPGHLCHLEFPVGPKENPTFCQINRCFVFDSNIFCNYHVSLCYSTFSFLTEWCGWQKRCAAIYVSHVFAFISSIWFLSITSVLMGIICAILLFNKFLKFTLKIVLSMFWGRFWVFFLFCFFLLYF